MRSKYELTDTEGNRIYLLGTIIYLSLADGGYNRQLGRIDGDKIIMKRNAEKHLFRKTNSYGFNHSLLTHLKEIRTIDLNIDKDRYLIPIDYVLDNGEFMNFKEQGFELQIFLRFELIENYKI